MALRVLNSPGVQYKGGYHDAAGAIHGEPGPDTPFGVTYDNSSHSKSGGWLKAAHEIGSTPLVIGVYPVAAPLVVAAFAAPFKTKTHFVYISWNDAQSGSMEVALEIGKGDFAGVFAELQRVTGKAWRNLPEERKKLLKDTKPGKAAKESIALNSSPASADVPEPSALIPRCSNLDGAGTFADGRPGLRFRPAREGHSV